MMRRLLRIAFWPYAFWHWLEDDIPEEDQGWWFA